MVTMMGLARNTLRSALCLFLLLLGLWVPLSAAKVVAAPLCTGHACDGLNPETMGCGADAVTGTSKNLGNGRAEHRISDACDAKWERTRLVSGSSHYAAGSLRFGCANIPHKLRGGGTRSPS